MASAQENIMCGICNEQDVIKYAVQWCPECDEGLCGDCEKHHRISKASRHHIIISIDDYKTLPTEISKINHHCEVHNKKFQVYCPYHDEPCCPACISKHHGNCSGLLDIDDVVKNSKTSSLLDTIEQSLRDSKNNIEKIIKDRQQNLLKITEQRKQIQEKINRTRDQINAHLDNLERKLIKVLDTTEEIVTSSIQQLLEKLKDKSKFVKQLQHNLAASKSHVSDLQTFLGAKQLEKQADQEEKYTRSLADAESIQTIDLKYVIDEKISAITAVSTFGCIESARGPTLVDIHTEKDKQAQMFAVRVHSGSIDDIKLTSKRKFNLSTAKNFKDICLTGCAFLHNGNLAFVDCDNNRRIVITNEQGILQSEISMSPSKPFDVTCLDNNSVAVTSYNDKNIKIINISSQTTTKTIPTTESCHGITNREGTLIYCEHGKGIILHQLGTKSSNTIVRQNIPDCTYVASNENNIYHTDYLSDTVTCYRVNGDKIWEFKDKSILRGPRGVAVDKHSNVYVTSNRNYSIILISSDGKKSRTILDEKDGIKDPWGLAVDTERDNLLVTCYRGTVYLYKLSFV